MSEQTALSTIDRAKLALSSAKNETQLIELAGQSAGIVSITNTAGYTECHSARMKLKDTRISIDYLGKNAREDAAQYVKAVIAEKDRLIGFIFPEENRLSALQNAWDEAKQAEKAAKKKAQDERCSKIRSSIDAIVDLSRASTLQSSDHVRSVIEYAKSINVSADQFQEFSWQAEHAKQKTLEMLDAILKDRVSTELEKERIAAERIELARLRADQAEKEADNQRKLQAENDRIAEERSEHARLLKIETDKIAAEWAKLEADKREAEYLKAERDKVEQRAKIDALLEEKRIKKIEQDKVEAEAKAKADAERIASEQPEMAILKVWIVTAEESLPAMKTIAGKAYSEMFRNVLLKALVEINERHV
jgi:hypothetical protein